MNRNLALFFDGTWNRRTTKTNVELLYELTEAQVEFHAQLRRPANAPRRALLKEAEQIKYYHAGVGTRRYEVLAGGLFGYGISRNITEGYHWLARHYEDGDRIFLFGFSRGAYTARSLAGLIRKCGIPRIADCALSTEAYHIYRTREWDPDGREASAFRRTYSRPDVSIHFMGLWDTVGALGIPAHRIWFGEDSYKFHDTELSRIVRNAFHALALDEHRQNFEATPWSAAKKPASGQTVEQRWFPGAHADVGGGGKRSELHEIPLAWIQAKAEECGLRFSRRVLPRVDAVAGAMEDSFGNFLFGLYQHLPGVFPYYRPFGMGAEEHIDDSVFVRTHDPNGKDEKGRQYSPPQLVNIPNR